MTDADVASPTAADSVPPRVGRWLTGVIAGLAALVALTTPAAAQWGGGGHMGGGTMGGGAGFYGLGPILWLLVIGAIVVLAAGYLRSDSAPTTSQTPTRDDALATLRQRYASGDLSEEEFERRRRTLLENQ